MCTIISSKNREKTRRGRKGRVRMFEEEGKGGRGRKGVYYEKERGRGGVSESESE